jgi:hypothetical protein
MPPPVHRFEQGNLKISPLAPMMSMLVWVKFWNRTPINPTICVYGARSRAGVTEGKRWLAFVASLATTVLDGCLSPWLVWGRHG